MPKFDLIAFDADDTLWQNERIYAETKEKFANLLTHYHPPEWVKTSLDETEGRNIPHFGFGVKSYALSMIETAVELSGGRVSGTDIQAIIDLARRMVSADIQLLDHVQETIPQLAASHPLMIITKGDLLDQENKVDRSGLGQYFSHIEVVSQKTRETYEKIINRHSIKPESLLMVGNSLKSDILPILELGGSAVYIPHEMTWVHEAADPPPAGTRGYFTLDQFGLLPALLEEIEGSERK